MKYIISKINKSKSRLLAFSLALVLSITMLSGCGQRQTFAEYCDSIFIDEITANTLNLHYTIENPKEYGIKKYDISLGSYSSDDQEDYASALKKMKLELLTYPYTSLTTEEQLTYDILSDYLDTQLQLCGFSLYEDPLSFSNGMQMQLPILLAEYKFNSEQDVKDYLELITLVDEYIDDIIEFEQDKSAAGLFMSDELCNRVIDSCEAFLENQDEHYMLTTFENRLDALDLSEKEVKAYTKSNKTTFTEQIVPAYEKLIEELTKLLGTGKNSGGVCNLPDGKEYYELLVYSETGCDDSIEDIYNRIERQRISDLLVCADLQEKEPTILEQLSYLEWEMENEDDMLSVLQEEMRKDFPECPSTNYTIHYVDPALEEYLAPAFYIVAPIDNYTDNAIYINNANDGSDIYYFATLAHEGFPGHLYQTVMSYEYELMPIRSILNYSGYVEGWATYIEMMSYYYGDLNDDVAAMLSHNQSATLSLYATSDIGLHYMGWTEADMYNFWSSYGITDKDILHEITQLILSEPGNYLKYYVGYIEFLELRDYAKNTLGNEYSTVEFHRTILDIGPAPFSILTDYLDEYYSSPQT
ncbi:MAG: DUF885 domain-containing protein [Agathobacter sp.]|nr:DUF885 domain-containing protein [Agathobacter sp.]